MLKSLRGSRTAKERVALIVANLGGGLHVSEACRRLGVSHTLFRRQRLAFLQAGLKASEPRPPGRPRVSRPPHLASLERLEGRVRELQGDLEMSKIREELLRILPYHGLKKRTPRAGSPASCLGSVGPSVARANPIRPRVSAGS